MNEFDPIPNSISHKELNGLLPKAYREAKKDEIKLESYSEEKEYFRDLINNWKELSQDLLTNLQEKKKFITEGKNPNSLMALGAMEVHINMAMQALKVSEKEE